MKNHSKRSEEKNIAVMVSIFYPDLIEEVCSYINRIPNICDIYISVRSDEYKKSIRKLLDKKHTLIFCDYVDAGMDIGPFLIQLKRIVQSGKKYSYYLKVHTKKDKHWRRSLLDACLPQSYYDELFTKVDKYHMVSSQEYLFPFSFVTKNSELLLSQIKKHNLHISEEDLYDTLKPFNRDTAKLDVDFYVKYHCDMVMRSKALKKKLKFIPMSMRRHWNETGKFEKKRAPNVDVIKSYAKKEYQFYAGTIFWFDDIYLDCLLDHLDSFEEIEGAIKKESGKLVNTQTTYTHHLEYWFGLIASHLIYPEKLKGISPKKGINKLVTFFHSRNF